MSERPTKPRQMDLMARDPFMRPCVYCREPIRLGEARTDPADRYVHACWDVRACHGRRMRPKLRLLPGGARY